MHAFGDAANLAKYVVREATSRSPSEPAAAGGVPAEIVATRPNAPIHAHRLVLLMGEHYCRSGNFVDACEAFVATNAKPIGPGKSPLVRDLRRQMLAP